MSAYHRLRFRITGASPLLLHNGRLADPLNGHAKAMAAISAKRRKTEADHLRLAELKFMGSLYWAGGEPCVPAEMMEAALTRAAATERRAAKAKAGLLIPDHPRLRYDGPREPRALWADPRFRLRCGAWVGTGRVMRTRPMFRSWSVALVVDFLPSLLTTHDVWGFLVIAGERIGIGDWRPQFGRFHVEGETGTGAPS